MKTNLYADFYCLKSCFRRILLFVFVLGSLSIRAQTVPVGMPFFEDALRRGQLMGVLDPNVSFMVRPVDPGKAMGISNPFGLDTLLFPLDSNHYSRYTDLNYSLDLSSGSGNKFGRASSEHKSNLRLTLLPIYTHSRYNKHHPYGWSDGAMVPNKGGEQYVSAGLFVKAFFLEAQLRPEYVWTQNSPFQNPPFRSVNIDMPERMGQENMNKVFLGQSYVKAHLGPVAIGLSNENIWWGPGIKNAIVMSNNAPGFGHFTLHTNKPIKTRIGTFEGELIAGKLKRSGYKYPLRYASGTWPPIAGDVIPDTVSESIYHSFMTGITLTWQPKWTPGLFMGVSRITQSTGEPDNLKDYFSSFKLASKNELVSAGAAEGRARNQIISVFGRYLFPESHAEVYLEIGREDNWWDLEDLLTRPRYSTAYLIGLRKMYDLPGKDRWLMFDGEYTKIQAPMDNIGRAGTAGYSFYTHGNGFGWTNQGQVLGAGIGPGSNMLTLGGTYGKGFNTFGIHFEHIAYNEDLFYTMIDYLKLGGTANPFFVDASKHFIDWGILLNYHTSYKKLMMGFQAQILRTYNYQWNYDPYGGAGPFRFTGINIWSLNAEVSLVYRF